MSMQCTLSQQEQAWILERRITRLTDNQEILIYPMGAERYLSSVLSGRVSGRYDLQKDIQDKNVLIIPGFATSAFLFAEAGAQSVVAYDLDPVTIAWLKAFKKYYHYRQDNYPSVGELLNALTAWYPPLLQLPFGTLKHGVFWLLVPKALRRVYIFYILSLVQEAIRNTVSDNYAFAHDLDFQVGRIEDVVQQQLIVDTVYVPYLLGVSNGIEKTEDIIAFIKQALSIAPNGHVLISPSRSTKEFYITGQSYFSTTGFDCLGDIKDLQGFLIDEDKYWFKTQGLAVFGAR